MGFRKDFVWGAATASYQIEGAAYEDGKGLNIWDMYCKEPDTIFEQHNGDVACDHYHRLEEDVALMVQLGLKAYRFSVSWSRIIPEGTGKTNQKGIDFYNRLIDLLIENNIEPYMTLYHWDLPYALHLKGGWLNPEIADWFGAYTDVIMNNFKDRVHNFITLNEPQVFVGCGYRDGSHAPGYKLGRREQLLVGHNVLRAHGKAVESIRKAAGSSARIGISMATTPKCPYTEADIETARKEYFRVDKDNFIFTYAYWLDPICTGRYNADILRECGDILPDITKEDLKLIGQPIDFIAANIYSGTFVTTKATGEAEYVKQRTGHPRTAFDWPVVPESLYWGPRFFCERYKMPYFISENGMSAHDAVSLDGKVHDPNREDYIHRYLLNYRRAADEGYDVQGYFAWSLMDNFEWTKGYDERFGMIYVDYETLKRTIKDSAFFYREVIESNGENL